MVLFYLVVPPGAYFIKLFTVDRVTFCHNVTDFWKFAFHKTMYYILSWQRKSWHLQKFFWSRHGFGFIFIKCHGNIKTLQCHHFCDRRIHPCKALTFRIFNHILTGFFALYDYLICLLHDLKISKWNMQWILRNVRLKKSWATPDLP